MPFMKKILVISALVITLGIALVSCKSHERCPAYGQAAVDQTEVCA